MSQSDAAAQISAARSAIDIAARNLHSVAGQIDNAIAGIGAAAEAMGGGISQFDSLQSIYDSCAVADNQARDAAMMLEQASNKALAFIQQALS